MVPATRQDKREAEACAISQFARTILVAVLAFMPSPCMAAQDVPPDAAVLHVKAQLVLLDVAVSLKASGEPLGGLSSTDFEVREEGVPQRVQEATQAAHPLSVVLLFDLTDTVHPVLQHLAGGASELLHHLQPADEVSVMSFSSHARVEQGFTHDRITAEEGLDAASTRYEAGEPTFLFEDLWQASQQTARSKSLAGRRVQIWVTDGSANDQDTQKSLAHHAPALLHTEAQTTAALLQSDAVVNVLIERSSLRGSGRFGDLEQLARRTGGAVVYAADRDAPVRLARLLDDLRLRYTLSYRPSQNRPEGALCRVSVALSAAFWAKHPEWKPRDVVLRSRESYVRSVTRTVNP